MDEYLENILTKKPLETNLISNPNTQYVILYDSVLNIEELKEIIQEYNPQIITFSLESHNFLVKNNIDHKLSENYLNEHELDSIQDRLYQFAQWYSNPTISKLIEYDGINIGELFYFEFSYFLIPILKKIYEIMRITEVYKNTLFFSSNSLINILKLYSSNIHTLNDTNPRNKQKHTSISTIITNNSTINKIKKNIMVQNNLSLFSQIIQVSYGLFKIVFPNKKLENNKQTILLINHTTKRFQNVLEKLSNYPINLVKYDISIPAFWDLRTLLTIKKSNCYIEHSTCISTHELNEKNSLFPEQLNNLFEEDFFHKFFSLNNISFWNIIKNNFIQMYKINYLNAIKEIKKIKFLFKKYGPSYILILGAENTPVNLITIKIAQKFRIKVGLMQHAMTTDDLYNSNNYIAKFDHFCRITPLYSDHFLVWDKLTQDHAIKHDVDSKKIILIGCPFFDTFFHDDKNSTNSKSEYILLAISPFFGIHTRQLSTQMQIEFENSIKQICQIITKMNKKLLIKVHHSSNFNEEIVKNINSNIIVKHTGNFYEYAKNCELLICIDMSTAILDTMLLKKPIISILITEKDSPSEFFRKNYVLQTEIIDLEKTLTKVFLDNKFKLSCIEQGEKFLDKYMINAGTSSTSLLNFLSNMKPKNVD